MFRYAVDDEIVLELQAPGHAQVLYDLVEENRTFLAEYLGWVGRVHSLPDMLRYMQRDLQGMADERRWSWLIRVQGQAAGRIGLWVTVPDVRECEINYWLAQRFTGRGIITRAARAIIDYAFTELDLRHVLIGFATENHASARVAQRLGFEIEFTLHDSEIRQDGSYTDLIFYGMLRDEWQITSQPRFVMDCGDNLHLRLIEPRHAPEQFALIDANMQDLRLWFVSMQRLHTAERERAFIERMTAAYGEGRAILAGIYSGDQVCGAISLSITPHNRSGQLGYWLDQSQRGKGIMSRAARMLTEIGFRVYDLNRIFLRVGVDNTASRAVAARLGMRQDAILRQEVFLHGRHVDHVVYSVLANEWKAGSS